MNETPQPWTEHEENVDPITEQPDAYPVGTGMSNGLAKAAIAGVVGALVGTVAGALADKRSAESINRTVKGLGDTVKGVAEGVAKGVNETVKGAGDAVKRTAEGVNDTVKGAVNAANGVAKDVLPSVNGTVDRVKDIEDAKPSGNQGVKPYDDQSLKLYEERLVADKKQVKTGEVVIGKYVETQTAHISVPVEKQRVFVERMPVDTVTPVDKSEANFHEGEAVRMEVYEETADIQKLAFVREQVSVRKEVEHYTVEAEDTIRREELDLDIQGSNIIDKTNTL